jgi:glycosyltransferase involved in cell wall biosynthesis/ADP-heptose:LPS heptosyltransferase
MINGKIGVHVYGPVLSRSGYGSHAREIIDYLLSDDRFIVFLENCNWGHCGSVHDFDFEDKDRIKRYYQCMANYDQGKQQNVQFDMSIYVTIPNEFKRRAQFCVGVHAGIEVDRCSHEWIKKCNEMDMIVVPSKHSADVLVNTTYRLQHPDGRVDEDRIKVPVTVIGQYFDKPKELKESKFKFSTKKNLLFVGLWGNKGGYGEDRKNIANLVRMFLTHFGANPDYGLVLKTSIITDSPEDLLHTKEKIKQIKDNFKNVKAKIYLIHENLSDVELFSLYSDPSITGCISLTNGEGFGRPLLEAASCGVPVLATNWSGHLDFLREKNGFIPIEYDMKEVPECQVWENVIDKGSRWANIREEDFKRRVKKFLESSAPIKKQAVDNIAWLEENFSKTAIHSRWNRFFDAIIKPIVPEGLEDISDQRILQAMGHRRVVEQEVQKLRDRYKIEKSMKQKALFIMPRSFGDIVICTSIVNSLIQTRHAEDEFYFATLPEYRELLNELVAEHEINVIDYDDKLIHAELTREIWDTVYNPGINVQYMFSNWTLGNGEFGVKLLEEFAKACNLAPSDLKDFMLPSKPCNLPKKQYISITPVSSKQSKDYKYWDDVIFNIKKMAPNVEIIQLGMKSERLLDGVLDYRGRSYSETIYIVSRSILHLSPDTGTAHVAGALGVPHIVLFGSTSYNQCAPILYKSKTAQVIIDTSEACEPRCYKDVCHKMPGGKNCLSHISPETVSQQVFNLLSGVKEAKIHLPVLRLDGAGIEKKVSEWHDSNSPGLPLHEHLGLEQDHYSKYVENQYEDINGN